MLKSANWQNYEVTRRIGITGFEKIDTREIVCAPSALIALRETMERRKAGEVTRLFRVVRNDNDTCVIEHKERPIHRSGAWSRWRMCEYWMARMQ